MTILLVSRYRFALDTSPTAPRNSVLSLSILRQDPRFMNALPIEAAQALSQAAPGQSATLFAVRGLDGELQWGLAEALSSSPELRGQPAWRIVRKNVDAVGFLEVDGHRQPMEARFKKEMAVFKVGRAYRGLLQVPFAIDLGRRLLSPIHQQIAYLEKPDGVSWSAVPGYFQEGMQRFGALAQPWSLPGRVELTVSGSSTGAALLPFVLYYRPASGQAVPKEKIESLAKNLLSDAEPQGFNISLPDGTGMFEYRHDADAVQITRRQNRFGETAKYTVPKGHQALSTFIAADKEAWISTEIPLIQTALLGNVGAKADIGECEHGGIGGFASVSGGLLPFSNRFEHVSVSVHNLETGLFTICGYYGP